MKRALLISSFLILLSCSQRTVPFGLRRTINQLDKNLNDTVKYDFKIAPESVSTNKQHFGMGLNLRNGKGLWKGGLLKTYFKLNGIWHPDDMSSIILTTYHRKLNKQPIEFREQKRYYKEYWEMSKIGGDKLEKWRSIQDSKENIVKDDSLYFSFFAPKRKVLGSINAWRKLSENHSSGSAVKYVAEIIHWDTIFFKSKIIQLGKPKEGYILSYKIGDTIENHPYGVYLIPE